MERIEEKRTDPFLVDKNWNNNFWQKAASRSAFIANTGPHGSAIGTRIRTYEGRRPGDRKKVVEGADHAIPKGSF